MAKKSTKKAVEVTPDVPVVENNIIENVIEEAVSNMPEEIEAITTEFENIKPSDELIETVIAEPEKAEELLNEKLDELNNLENAVKNEIDKVIKNNPSLKKNSQFTYFWNGMNLYE